MVIWEYDSDGRCENLVGAEQKDSVMLLKESPIPCQSSSANNTVKPKLLKAPPPTILLSLNAFQYLCRLSVRSNITLALGIQLFSPKGVHFLFINWLIASIGHYLQRSIFK